MASVGPGPADEQVGAVFFALADPTRRHLVEALAAEPGSTATGLAATLPISRQAVAKHLKLLGDAGLVSCRRSGREARFELQTAPLAEAVAWIGAVGAEWDRGLGGLRRLLEPGAQPGGRQASPR
ncbi:MAG: metalloregulator ArsR/SmtB family transcription factor [Solirubrobacterales bacterium]